MNHENILIVTANYEDVRLDRFLRALFPNIPYTAWAKMMRKGNVRLNGGRTKGNESLSVGDKVRIPPELVLKTYEITTPTKKRSKIVSKKEIDLFQSLILKDTPDILFLNKPTGLATQGGTNIKISVDDMAKAYGEVHNIKLKLVHRLDRDTSGLLMLAKSEKAARQIGRLLKDKQIQKYYIALTLGVPIPHDGVIKAPLDKVDVKSKEMMQVSETGKKSETHYIVLDKMGKVMATVLVEPKTGRTHQIRCHMSYMETPILGDHKYGVGDAHGSSNLCLHALTVRIPHYKNIPLCPFPDHLQKLFKTLGINQSNILQQAKVVIAQNTST